MATTQDTLDYALSEAGSAAEGVTDAFLRRMADRIGARSGAAAVYGEPVTADGVTIIPVARSRWGFGGGAGRGEDDEERAGGGGGAMSAPVGYIEIADGEARFIGYRDPSRYWPLVVAGGIAGWLLLRGLRSLFR